ncbi:hypothetical protein EI94DRAFT_1765499, partial [Lactarius quietus]
MRAGCVLPCPPPPSTHACFPTPPHSNTWVVAPGCRHTGWGSQGRGVGVRSPSCASARTHGGVRAGWGRVALVEVPEGDASPLHPFAPALAQQPGAWCTQSVGGGAHPCCAPSLHTIWTGHVHASEMRTPTPQLTCKGRGDGEGAPVGRVGEGPQGVWCSPRRGCG